MLKVPSLLGKARNPPCFLACNRATCCILGSSSKHSISAITFSTKFASNVLGLSLFSVLLMLSNKVLGSPYLDSKNGCQGSEKFGKRIMCSWGQFSSAPKKHVSCSTMCSSFELSWALVPSMGMLAYWVLARGEAGVSAIMTFPVCGKEAWPSVW